MKNFDERLTISVPEAAKALGISRTLAYKLAGSGKLPAIRLGRRFVVPVRAIEEMLRKSVEK